MARSTRKQTELFLLAQPLEALSQIVLPTGEDVLRRVVRVWERAHIPVVPLRSIMKKLETLVGKYEVRKKAKKRQSEGDKVSDALLQGHLASLFDIAAPATSSFMIHLKQKDKDFLDDQRGQRKMVMSTVDKESMAKESRKHERLAAERRRKEELAETLERGEMYELVTGSSATAECADSSTSSSDTNSSARGSAAASASRPKRLKITKEVAAAADRVKLTSRGAHHVFSAIAADQGVLSPSTSSIRRHRKVLRKETAEAAVKDYRNQVQEHDAVFILHWDGKLLPGSESQGHVDRLAIVVTSPSLEGEKLLAIPALPSGTGEAMASKVEETIRHWKFEDRVEGLCFDTTASNTGVHAGCCTLLEQKLGRPLNLACRHHVMELILASAFKATFATLRPAQTFNYSTVPKEVAHSHKSQCYDHQRPTIG
ncbi:hypothetical protein GWK47_040937 [Chionoecetes opilio]|uniref:Uncharacterized protein n=2 Tax=Chionoecetes opilio TaxID=41210 RepID=A0A8J4YI91_CHIOP|nr:hypothetical protein GWK47_040937 [Chionoecetes opilio]